MPGDVPAQLGNRVQHALRAFTPDDAKALKATVRTFPESAYDLEEVLTSGLGPIGVDALEAAVKGSPLWGRYAEAVDREIGRSLFGTARRRR